MKEWIIEKYLQEFGKDIPFLKDISFFQRPCGGISDMHVMSSSVAV